MVAKTIGTDQKEVLLMQSFFVYVSRCLQELDSQAIRRLGLRHDQIQRISKMTTQELMHLGSMGGHCLSIKVDASCLDDVLSVLDTRLDHQALVEDCIRHDAPRVMMECFFGLSSRQYTKLRELCGMPPHAGRHKQATPEQASDIFDLWDSHQHGYSARVMLLMAVRLELSLRIVWDEFQVARGTDRVPRRSDSAPEPPLIANAKAVA